MFLITDMTTGKHRISTAFASYDDAVTALGGPAECNDWCSRNGCDIIWHDDDECILQDWDRTIVVHPTDIPAWNDFKQAEDDKWADCTDCTACGCTSYKPNYGCLICDLHVMENYLLNKRTS